MSLPDVPDLLAHMEQQLEKRIRDRQLTSPLVVGIHTGGAWVAEYLYGNLLENGMVKDPMGMLDISFYRDDFTRIGLHPKVKPSRLPVSCEGRHVILVDDVLMSGRTIRAALNALFELGRPASVTLVALVDLDAAELPIHADIVGEVIKLEPGQRVKLVGPENLSLKLKTLEP